jgi:hypothetical protein
MEPAIQAFFDEQTFTVSYLVSDPVTKKAVILDSVLDFGRPPAPPTACLPP